MSLYHPVSTKGTASPAICDRCRMRKSYDELQPDPNIPGLRVCPECKDEYDPYKLPMKPSEKIVIKYPRPDVPLE